MMFHQRTKSQRIFKQLAKALIKLHICTGWSKPLLVAYTTLLEISCAAQMVLLKLFPTESIFPFYTEMLLCPQRNFGMHIVIALSVRPSVRPSVVLIWIWGPFKLSGDRQGAIS